MRCSLRVSLELPSHGGIVADQFYLIAFGIGYLERTPKYPCVLGGLDLIASPTVKYS